MRKQTEKPMKTFKVEYTVDFGQTTQSITIASVSYTMACVDASIKLDKMTDKKAIITNAFEIKTED